MRGRALLAVLLALLGVRCAGARRELALPDVRQATDYTCGAAALQSILAYFGEESREDRLAQELGATPEAGVPPQALLRVARAHGLIAELRENLSLSDLARAVDQGTPVLIALQAWPDKPRHSFANEWEQGHYVVVVSVERERLIFEDPSLLGSRGVLSLRDFEDRWHDTDGKKRYVRMGIFFSGKPPAPPPAYLPIE
jgi:predicted double-glycine peptidase